MAERRRVEQRDEPQQDDRPIHIKYRPSKLKEVVGQREVVQSLSAALKEKTRQHAFLFCGPPGTGKTTLARIVAAECGVPEQSVLEVDVASNAGVDDVDKLLAPLMYSGFGESPNKAIILDECHRFSKQAWDKFLKPAEDASRHVYFFFCTSEGEKVPAAIVRRCLAYNLRAVRRDDLVDLLEGVCKAERYDTPDAILALVADAANGSPGLALSLLTKVHACDDERDAAALLEAPLEAAELIDVCRLMIREELRWDKLTSTLKELDMPAESVRIVVANYLAGCLMNPKGGGKDIVRFLEMLEPFTKPFNASDKMAPLLVAFGRVLYPI